MSDTTPAQNAAVPQAGNPEPQAGDGQQMEQEQSKTPLSPEDAAAALVKARQEAADYRRKLREAEGRLATADKAKADAEAAALVEQGKYKELYEKAQADAQANAAKLAQMEHDQLRRDAAQAAGIPQLWQRLQGETAEALAEDAKALAGQMAPAPANGQPRQGAPPTPTPQGSQGLTDEERRKRAARTF